MALDPVLDTAPCGFLVIDDTGVVRTVNTTLAQLVGRRRDEIEGSHIDQLLSSAGRIFYSTHLFPLLRLHGRADELYLRILHADGSQIPVLINGAARSDLDPPVYHVVVMPMLERNKLESELIAARNDAREAAAAKDRFLSIVSHELRSPLTGITGFSELLLRERGGPLTDQQRRYAERIRDAAQYQVGLIEDILEFAALSGERRGLDSTVMPLEDVLSRAESILSLRAADAGKALHRRPKPAAGELRGDAAAVQQILLNLGMNAIKYGAPAAPVVVAADRAADAVRVGITDAGPGIPADQLERIFEPFVQLDVSSDAGSGGVGLGLAISRDLARAMGGDILVQSEPGRGSTFTLVLPAE